LLETFELPTTAERWARLDDFNPFSPPQVLAYIKQRKLHTKRDRKTGNLTTSEDALLEAAKKAKLPEDDPVFQIIKCRKISKNLGYLYDTFLGADGRLHPEYTQLPDTGRLSSRSPNIQNQPQGRANEVEAAFAKAIRSTIIPSPGCLLAEVDWKGLQALLVAHFAGDPDYARICEIDVHSYLAAVKVGKPADLTWDDAKLAAYLGKIKKDHPLERHLCKTGNHADAFDIQIPHLSEVLGSVEEAIAFKKLRAEAFPKIKQWQIKTRMQAHFDGFLQTQFGWRRYFWNVFEPKPDGSIDFGSEAWEALAFPPQGNEAGMLKEVLLQLKDAPGYGVFWWLLAPIHDSLLIEALEPKMDEAIGIVKTLMEQPWPQLDGLSVKTDHKVGKVWSDCE
jgi:DNA polymerase I